MKTSDDKSVGHVRGSNRAIGNCDDGFTILELGDDFCDVVKEHISEHCFGPSGLQLDKLVPRCWKDWGWDYWSLSRFAASQIVVGILVDREW